VGVGCAVVGLLRGDVLGVVEFRKRSRRAPHVLVTIGDVEERTELWVGRIAQLEPGTCISPLAIGRENLRFAERGVRGGLVGGCVPRALRR
jgi:hypothetical protein